MSFILSPVSSRKSSILKHQSSILKHQSSILKHQSSILISLIFENMLPYSGIVRKWANHPNVHIALSSEQQQDMSFILKV
jgi:hypothetical protein